MFRSYAFDLKKFLLSVSLPIILGLVLRQIIKNQLYLYSQLTLTSPKPPAALFPIVWTILYLLMGISFYRIWNSDKPKGNAVYLYFLQLFVNFMWPILFFNLRAFSFSFVWLLILITIVFVMIIFFFKNDLWAGFLQLPYLIWLIYAATLNYHAIGFNFIDALETILLSL